VSEAERGDYNPSLDLALTIAELFRLPIEAIFSLKPMTPLSEEIFREPPVEPR
jgi:putative transcriptional regulator